MSWFIPRIVPEYATNVNTSFCSEAWKITLICAAVLFLILIVTTMLTKEKKNLFEFRGEKIYISDLILILLPLTPIVQYILNNQDILSLPGSFYIIAIFAAFSVLFIFVIPMLLGIVVSNRTLMLGGLAFTFMITNMASLSDSFHWLETGSLGIQLAIFAGVFIACWILYNLVGRKFLYALVAIFFIANSMINLMPGDDTDDISTEFGSYNDNQLVKLVGSEKPLYMPNIYLLIYDAYVINETMLRHGIDNSVQEGYLQGLGFTLYPHSYSIDQSSNGSMTRVLNASRDFYGNRRRGTSGDGVVQNLLKSFGYETYGIFWSDYFFQGIGSSYDYSFPVEYSFSNHKLLSKAILMGEFRFDVEFDQPNHEQFIEYKRNIFNITKDKPRFIYTHTHIPGHSQNSGDCLPNETELYQERLTNANKEMKEDLEAIIENDPDAIVIVAGDHGPYLTKNCDDTGNEYDISDITRLDIQDRYGIFLAIKWPTGDFSEYDNITVLQDLFPTVFAYLFDDDKFLEAKVFTRTMVNRDTISGAYVERGIIHGGVNDGEPLFLD